MKLVVAFLTMIAVAVVLWRVLLRQEAGDRKFQRRLEADERRAKANREAAARSAGAPERKD